MLSINWWVASLKSRLQISWASSKKFWWDLGQSNSLIHFIRVVQGSGHFNQSNVMRPLIGFNLIFWKIVVIYFPFWEIIMYELRNNHVWEIEKNGTSFVITIAYAVCPTIPDQLLDIACCMSLWLNDPKATYLTCPFKG